MIQLPPKFKPMFSPKRVKVYFGGRGGAKTESFASVATVKAASEGKRVLCLREFMNSISDSVHNTLETVIERNGLEHHFEIQRSQIINRNTGDVAFSYGQLSRNVQSIKSKQGIDIAWIEEGETISKHSLSVLIPTLRKAGSELWISFNPEDEFGPVYEQYVAPYRDVIDKQGFYEDDYLYVCKVNLEDNPFATDELIRESERLRKSDYKEWLHVWGGEPVKDYSDSLIKPEWVKASIDAHEKLGYEPKGVRVIGFDPADTGRDSKAMAGRYGYLVNYLHCWSDHDLSDAISQAFQAYTEHDLDFLVYDSIGVGSAVKVASDRDDPMKRMRLEPFNGAGSVDHPGDNWRGKSFKDTFRNKRAQYYWLLAERFENTYNAVEKGLYSDPEQMISIDSSLELIDALRMELSSVKRVRRAGMQLLQVESKEEMLKRGVRSPNLADALVYCFANPAPERVNQELPLPNAMW